MVDPKSDQSQNDSIKRGHETSDADFKNIMVTGAGLLAVMVAGLVISFVAYKVFMGYSEDPGASPGTFVTGEQLPALQMPSLQASPRDTLMMIRKAEDSVLTGYGWTNRDSGLVRVPIDRAKHITLEKGLPQREGNTP